MHTTYRRIVIAVAAAAVTVALVCSAAGAARLEIPNSERGFRFRIVSTDFIAGLTRINCELIMSGSFRTRTFAKTAGLVIGEVNTAILQSCTEGAGTLLTETRPWSLRYATYTGTLPNIAGVTFQIIGFPILIQPMGGISCLYTSSAAAPLIVTAPVTMERIFEKVQIVETAAIPLSSGMGCPGSLTIRGEGAFTVAGEFASVRIRLI